MDKATDPAQCMTGEHMPKPLKKALQVCEFFSWKVGTRDGVFYADGRTGNRFKLGRHSLGTRSPVEAKDALRCLDARIAAQFGVIPEVPQERQTLNRLTLTDGWNLYHQHVGRPRVAGGGKPKTMKRYRAVFDKFIRFANSIGLLYWNGVTTKSLEQYAAWLDSEGYAYRTEYLELTTIKQTINWLKVSGHLPESVKINLVLRKPTGTDTYCWKPEEVSAMVQYCRAADELQWLGDVIVALASTGLRISELASLRRSDVNLESNVINLTDESASRKDFNRRETKNARSRSFPISRELRLVLVGQELQSDGLLFHGPKGGKLKPDTLRNVLVREVLKPLSKRFPSPPKSIGFLNGRLHSFRHYFCSACANRGVSERAVMKWLGHQDSKMVSHYYHLHDQEAQRQMEMVQFITNTGDTVSPVTH
jgi:integrase